MCVVGCDFVGLWLWGVGVGAEFPSMWNVKIRAFKRKSVDKSALRGGGARVYGIWGSKKAVMVLSVI